MCMGMNISTMQVQAAASTAAMLDHTQEHSPVCVKDVCDPRVCVEPRIYVFSGPASDGSHLSKEYWDPVEHCPQWDASSRLTLACMDFSPLVVSSYDENDQV